MTKAHPAQSYITFYENLSPDSLKDLATVCHEDVFFKDPFNEITGLEAYRLLLAKMFESAPDIKFKVLQCAYDGDVCFLRWDSQATVKVLGKDPWAVKGMTEIHLSEDGRVIAHIDHWDAASQFYERLPILGSVLRFIRRRVASH